MKRDLALLLLLPLFLAITVMVAAVGAAVGSSVGSERLVNQPERDRGKAMMTRTEFFVRVWGCGGQKGRFNLSLILFLSSKRINEVEGERETEEREREERERERERQERESGWRMSTYVLRTTSTTRREALTAVAS